MMSGIIGFLLFNNIEKVFPSVNIFAQIHKITLLPSS